MTNRSKHLPYYVTIIGLLSMSLGYNLVQYEESKLLKQEKTMYRVFFEYLYDKVEELENKQKADRVYNIVSKSPMPLNNAHFGDL